MEMLFARRCIVNGKKAIFHTWSEVSKVVPPSNMIGGHPGGVVKGMVAIIEYEEDGTVHECNPNEVRFTDNIVNRLINGEYSNEPVGLFGTISIDHGKPPEASIGKLDSMETIRGLHGELIKYLKFKPYCTSHNWVPVHNSNDIQCSKCGVKAFLKLKGSEGE